MPIVAAVGTITTMTENLESLENPPGTVARLRADTHRIRRNFINIHLTVKGKIQSTRISKKRIE